MSDRMVLCRENGKKITIYPIEKEPTPGYIRMLKINSDNDPNLTYYAVSREKWLQDRGKICSALLRRKIKDDEVAKSGLQSI